jgi:hypothetical protein
MNDYTFAGPLFVFVMFTLMAVMFWAGRQSMVPRVRAAATMFEPVTAHPTVALAQERDLTKALTGVIEVITTTQVVPVSEWSSLPYQQVPSPVQQATLQALVDTAQDQAEHIKELQAALRHVDSVRAKHWRALKRLRGRVALMVDVQELGVTEALRMRSLTVAKSAATRAAELSNALSEIEVARFESTDLDTFNEAVESIYANHQLTGATP